MRDKKLLGIVEAFRSGLLAGKDSAQMCAVVCRPLHGYLSFLGIETRLVEGLVAVEDGKMDHVWLRLPDGRVLDPTIDQFGAEYPPVYLGPPLALHGAALEAGRGG